MGALEPKLSHLTIQIATAEPGLEVQRDGHVVGAALLWRACAGRPRLASH